MRLALLSLALLLAAPAQAQHDGDHGAHGPEATADVRAAIDQLFDGMRTKDTTAVRAVLHPSARLMTSVTQDGVPNVVETDMNRFILALAASDIVWDERVEDGYAVHVDDGLAVAWVPYEFYAGETFSHCGVNAMTFARTAQGWQILQITDTRRPECL